MSVQCPPGATTYIIRAGDTLSSIAQRFGTTVAAILAANPGLNPNSLQVARVICIPTGQRPGTCPVGRTPYTVRPGDNLFSIAQRNGISVEAILAANPGLNPSMLRVGQTICLPVSRPPVTCPRGTTSYIIRPGDNLFSIAQRNGTTVAAILAANPGLNPSMLRVGQTICLPVSRPPVTCPAGTTSYIIQPGDTIVAIARRNGTTVAAILAANPGLNPSMLRVGQTICLPVSRPPVTCPAGTTSYIIQPGDTIVAIARRNGTTVAAILAANPGLNPSMLRVGQTICLPVSRPPVTCPRGTTSYIIRPGDNLFSIAQRNGTTVAAILAANPGLNPSMLRVGQAICIPVIRSREIYPEGSIPYTIQPGENLYTLAQSFETTPSAILEANPGLNPDLLEAGQTIYMPMSLSQEICSAGNIPYTIQPGENLYTLAQSFGTTPSAILEANPGLNPDLLQAGQTICVSMSRPQEICPAGSTAYTIQPGESIYQIAARFNTSVAAILSLNPGINSTSLESGQTICIPFTDPGRRDEDISEEEAPSQ